MIPYDNQKWWILAVAFKGTAFKKMAVRIAAFMLLTVCLAVLQGYKYPIPSVNSTIHTLLGTALGLLLVFRTNASYDRYWEGRKMWGQIVNNTRSLVRVAVTNYHNKGNELEGLAAIVSAFPFAVKNNLRQLTDTKELVELLRDQAAVDKIVSLPNRATAVLLLLSHWVAEKARSHELDYWAARTLEAHIAQLADAQGALERIKDTPIPFAYAVHTHQFLMLYLITLPFTMVVTYQYYALVAVFIVSFGLLGIDEAGVEIEDPFGLDDNDLPLDAMCDRIKKLMAAMVKFEASPLNMGEYSSTISRALSESAIAISDEPPSPRESSSAKITSPTSIAN